MPRSTQKASERDLDLARRVASGDDSAKDQFYETYQPVLAAALALRARDPATRRGAAEVTLELLGDCTKTPRGNENSPAAVSLLQKYLHPARHVKRRGGSITDHEIGPLEAWLKRVAFNRFHDWLEDNHLLSGQAVLDHPPVESGPSPEEFIKDEEALERVRAALGHGFKEAARLQPLGLVSLRLAWLHDVQIRQLAVAWARHQANVTPYMKRAMDIIRKETLRRLRKDDPSFSLSWEDLVLVFSRYPGIVHKGG